MTSMLNNNLCQNSMHTKLSCNAFSGLEPHLFIIISILSAYHYNDEGRQTNDDYLRNLMIILKNEQRSIHIS